MQWEVFSLVLNGKSILPYQQLQKPIHQLHLKSNVHDWSTSHKLFFEQQQQHPSTLATPQKKHVRIWKIPRNKNDVSYKWISHKYQETMSRHSYIHNPNANCWLLGTGNPLMLLFSKGGSVNMRAQQLKSRSFGFVQTKLCVTSWDLIVPTFLHDPKSLKFGVFLLVPNLTCTEVIELEEARFYLQSSVPIFPQQPPSSSRVF